MMPNWQEYLMMLGAGFILGMMLMLSLPAA